MRQLDAELRRFFARRIVSGTFLVVALIIVISVGISTGRGKPGGARSVERGSVVPAAGPVTGPSDSELPQIFVNANDTRMNIGKHLANALAGTGVALMFAGFALGASFVGAEFNVGSLTTQLLFESRRERVHGAKAAAVAIGSAGVVCALLAILAGSMYLGSVLHGVVAASTARSSCIGSVRRSASRRRSRRAPPCRIASPSWGGDRARE